MVIVLGIILVIAILFFGAYQIRKVDRVLSGNDGLEDLMSFDEPDHYIYNNYRYEGGFPEELYFRKSYLEPKEYGILFGNGKSRIKKTNRLKFRK